MREGCSPLAWKMPVQQLHKQPWLLGQMTAFSHQLIIMRRTLSILRSCWISRFQLQKKYPSSMTLTLSPLWCRYFQKTHQTSSRECQPTGYGNMCLTSIPPSIACGSTAPTHLAWEWVSVYSHHPSLQELYSHLSSSTLRWSVLKWSCCNLTRTKWWPTWSATLSKA